MYMDGLDEIDNRIVSILKENARMNLTEIGEQVGLSRVAVKKRMEAMEEKGVIRGYHAVIDASKAVEGTKFFLDVEVYPQDFEDFLKKLSKVKCVREIYTVSGDARIHAVGYASNQRELTGLVDSLYRTGGGVRRLSCHTVLSTIKDVDGGIEYVQYQESEHLEGRQPQPEPSDTE